MTRSASNDEDDPGRSRPTIPAAHIPSNDQTNELECGLNIKGCPIHLPDECPGAALPD
jgi:hypothetical protein